MLQHNLGGQPASRWRSLTRSRRSCRRALRGSSGANSKPSQRGAQPEALHAALLEIATVHARCGRMSVAIAASELHRCTVEEVRGSSRRGGRKQANAALHLCTAPRCCAQPERTLYLPSFAQLQLLEIPSLTLRKRASELDCNVQQLQLLDRARVLPWLWSCIQRLNMLVSTSREQLPCGTGTRPVTVRSAPYRPRGAPWAVAKPQLTSLPARSCQQL